MSKFKVSAFCLCFIGVLIASHFIVTFYSLKSAIAQLPEYDQSKVIENHEWHSETLIEIVGYSLDAMEVGISADSQYLLFNDKVEGNKDLHWATKINEFSYKYQGRVKNTVSEKVDGTPSFDASGNLYFTTLKSFPKNSATIYVSKFRDGVAIDPQPLRGDIYVTKKANLFRAWVSLDPDISDDGSLLFYSEGQFGPYQPFPYPFNLRGAKRIGDKFKRLDDRILANVNSDNLDYAPGISNNGLELFFSRIGKVNGKPEFVGIYTAKRSSLDSPFSKPERIMAISGQVEAPVLSSDERHLYYHRMDGGRYKVYRVSRTNR